MRQIVYSAVFAAVVGMLALAEAKDEKTPLDAKKKPQVQLALLLDTSGSMSGLIEQAKGELWRIVNELITAKQNGVAPELHVALYEYGNDGLSQESGWVRQIAPLTTDLDKISEELFKLSTNGGEEYCGLVIQRAVNDLAWSASGNDLKMIVIAGNEPFSQGPVDYRIACKAAITKGIMVNTIHCGGGIPDDWRDGAVLADGKAMNIDQNLKVVHIDSPHDREIARLGEELNKTYVPYGKMGAECQSRQWAQDANAVRQSAGSGVSRSISKANAYYCNDAWDLVDAVAAKKVELAKIKAEDLPESMRKMSVSERQTYIDAQAMSRKDIQKQINDLNAQRQAFVDAKTKESAEQSQAGGAQTLDRAIVSAIRSQATGKQFSFEESHE